MVKGYAGKILRVNLTTGKIWTEEPPDSFYRRYIGGQGFVARRMCSSLLPARSPASPWLALGGAAWAANRP